MNSIKNPINNTYINQIHKPKKQNIFNNTNSENTKNLTDSNINQNVNLYPTKVYFIKKTVHKNCYPINSNLINSDSGFLSQNNIQNKEKLDEKLEIITDSTISGKKLNQKNYKIINPLKERNNFENNINSFNRTYAYFSNKDSKNISYISSINYQSRQKEKNMEKVSLNLSSINYQNIPTKLNNYNYFNENNSYKDLKSITPIKSQNNNKKYFYQEKIINNEYLNDKNNNSYYKLDTKSINPIMTPLPSNNLNISNMNSPNSNNNALKINNEKNGRSDKTKIKSRQFFKQYYPPSAKSSGIHNENIINYDNSLNFHSPLRKKSENKYIENVSILNSQTIPSISSNIEDISNTINSNNKYRWIKKDKNKSLNNIKDKNYNINQNIINLRDGLNINLMEEIYSNIDKNVDKEIKEKEKEIMELSAIIIQSAFRGYMVKNKLETFLYNCKSYNKGLEKIVNIYISILDKNINIIEEKKIFINNLILLHHYLCRNISDIIYKSYKTSKLLNFSNSPFTEKDANHTIHYKDIFLHKEIGERFNIIKKNKEKELEKKYKEELYLLNNKINQLIEENNKLKDINNKNKYNENKFKELSMDNKKKDNIINIITSDNQSLAKKLKIIKDKNYKLEINNQTSIIFFSENNEFKKSKELLKHYRNLYLLLLIHKKNLYLLDLLRKYFDKYKNNVKQIEYNNNIALFNKQKLAYLINKKRVHEFNYLNVFFMKLCLEKLKKDKEIENKNSIIKTKLKNIIINRVKYNKYILKSSFHRFYYKGMISSLIHEKNKYNIDKKKENFEKIKKLIILINNRKDKHNFLIIRDCFDKWNLLSKILGMKAITDEKKRKKRQKQRMKKKSEYKSVNKYTTNNNNIVHLVKNNNINIINKEKDILLLDHSITTDFSGAEINSEKKVNRIMKATEKLREIFYNAAKNYNSLENTKNNLSKNKDDENNKIEIKENKNDNKENDNEYEEDSGDSFGI